MEKTELMYRFEQETWEEALVIVPIKGDSLTVVSEEYTRWCEEQYEKAQAKAASYDRMMSKGLSMQELANVLRHPVAIENNGGQDELYHFGETPHLGQYSDGTTLWSCYRKWRLPRNLVYFTGDWKDSLTLPDGWNRRA